MASPRTLNILLFLPTALLICALSIPLILGKIPRNGWYGFRTAKTLSKDEIWYPANRTAGWDLFFAGLAILAACAFLLLFPHATSFDTVYVLLAVTTLSTFLGLAHSLLVLRKLH